MSSKDQQSSAAPFSYFDGQKVGVPLGAFIALVSLGLFFEQFDLANFGYTAPAIAKYWKVGMDWVGKTNGLGSFGMMAGAFIGGWFSDKVGRKLAFLIATTLYGIATVLCGLAPTPLLFVIGRVVTMMGVSALAVTAMVYVAEMVPAGQRGALAMRVLAVGMLANPLGGLFAKWVVAKGPEGWRWQYYWGGGFALVEVILVLIICYESPRWLVSKGKTLKAKIILEKMLPGVTVDESALVAEKGLAQDSRPARHAQGLRNHVEFLLLAPLGTPDTDSDRRLQRHGNNRNDASHDLQDPGLLDGGQYTPREPVRLGNPGGNNDCFLRRGQRRQRILSR